MSQSKYVVVTGANKGIGYGIVEHLADNENMKVIMACRNVDRGNKAKEEIKAKRKDAQLCV